MDLNIFFPERDSQGSKLNSHHSRITLEIIAGPLYREINEEVTWKAFTMALKTRRRRRNDTSPQGAQAARASKNDIHSEEVVNIG